MKKQTTSLNISTALLLGSLLLVPNCAWIKATTQEIVNTCEEEVVADLAASLVPQVYTILAAKNVNWERELDWLLSKVGEAALCAVEIVMQDLKTHQNPMEGYWETSESLDMQPSEVIFERSEYYLLKH
jgi:hypothetical protein